MAEGITRDEMKEVLREIFGKSGSSGGSTGGGRPMYDPKNPREFEKAMQESVNAIKKNLTFGKQFEGVLRGQRKEYEDYSKDIQALNKELEVLAKTVQKSGTAAEVLDYNKKVEYRNAIEFAHQIGKARAGVQTFAVGMGSVLQNVVSASWQYVKSLSDGASGIEAGNNLAAAAAQQTGKTIGEVGKFLGAMGPLLGTVFGVIAKFIPGLRNLPTETIAKTGAVIGTAFGVVGLGAEALGDKLGTVAKEGVEFLGKQLVATEKGFREITQAGATFGGGMDELRKVAAGAGLDITQLSNVVKASKDDLVGMGLGLGEATKRVAAISGELRRSELGMQLRKLGYSAEEQASLAASLSARLSASGDNRMRSDAEVARMTAQYGKDLRILSDITGQDAKKKLEEARVRAQEQDLLAEAMRKGGPEAMRKLEAQLATMPQSMKKGYMEFVSTGGTAIADAATNVAIVQNPKIMEQYQQMYNTLGDSSKDASTALTETGSLTELTVKYARENADASKEIGIAARLVGSAITKGATDITNDLILEAARRKEGATAAAKAAADELAVSTKPLNTAVAQINQQADALRTALADKVTPHVITYGEKMAAAAESLDQVLKKLGIKIEEVKTEAKDKKQGVGETIGQNVGEAAGGIAGSVLGGVVGRAATTKIGAAIGTAIAPGIGTAIGAGLGFLAGGLIGSVTGKLGAYLGKKIDDASAESPGFVADVPMAAGGNILTGPLKGYLAMLHGTEAVVPLPDGRRIPVDIDLSQLTSSTQSLINDVESVKVDMDRLLNQNIDETYTSLNKSTRGESEAETLIRDQLNLLNEIKDILAASNSLQQQYVYNTYK